MRVTPHASLAWQHAFVDVGAEAVVAPDATLGLSYAGQLADEVADHAVTGRLDWRY